MCQSDEPKFASRKSAGNVFLKAYFLEEKIFLWKENSLKEDALTLLNGFELVLSLGLQLLEGLSTHFSFQHF